MLKYRVFLIVLLACIPLFAQDFSKIQQKTNTYSGVLTAEKLTKNITRDFTSDEERVMAIYAWITKNIRYDLEEFFNPTRNRKYRISYRTPEELKKLQQQRKDSVVQRVLSERKAVCQGYAETFSKICNLLSLENEIVSGNVRFSARAISKPPGNTNHAWNVVKIANKWIFVDTTWGSGYSVNGKWQRYFNSYFYDMPSKTFFKTHYPNKAKWRLLIGRISKETFYAQPIFYAAFLTSGVEVLSKYSGTLFKNKDGKVSFQLKNIKASQDVYIGFHGNPMAQKPNITRKDNFVGVSVEVPENVHFMSVIIDRDTYADFRIK